MAAFDAGDVRGNGSIRYYGWPVGRLLHHADGRIRMREASLLRPDRARRQVRAAAQRAYPVAGVLERHGGCGPRAGRGQLGRHAADRGDVRPAYPRVPLGRVGVAA